jgi:putative acetyltransferase
MNARGAPVQKPSRARHNFDGPIDGIVSLKRADAAICEMKRLYVRARLGYELIENVIGEARRLGYFGMRLDVLAEFARAKALYAAFGFAPAEPISFNPLPGTAFLGLRLN